MAFLQPIVSVANVSQLAVDILIATFGLWRVGIFDPTYHVPIVGGREDGLPGVTTPIELFGNDNLNFVVIQQRSPVLKVSTGLITSQISFIIIFQARKEKFTSALIEFIKEVKFKSVLFVSGVDASNRMDSQMQ